MMERVKQYWNNIQCPIIPRLDENKKIRFVFSFFIFDRDYLQFKKFYLIRDIR